MDRRNTLKLLAATLFGSSGLLRGSRGLGAQDESFASGWASWPDLRWAGPDCWGNRLQDWWIRDGRVWCGVRGPGRTLHCLTHEIVGGEFHSEVTVDPLGLRGDGAAGRLGFRVGISGPGQDYRSAAVHGEGLDAALDGAGRLLLGEAASDGRVPLDAPVRLRLETQRESAGVGLVLTARRVEDGVELARTVREGLHPEAVAGNLALLASFPEAIPGPAAAFSDWRLGGPGVSRHPERAFGPVMFAQYTLHRGTLKLTAQLAPVEAVPGASTVLEVREAGGDWREAAQARMDPLARTAAFRVEGWDGATGRDYRVRLTLPLRTGPRDYLYEGSIAAEPDPGGSMKAAVFSCNADHGFPDTEVVRNVAVHRPDLALFLGDQFYEGNGGFGIQPDPVEEAALDMLHKWYMFGWSYREIFRRIPAAFIPDDHDVYHGNVWGEGGKRAPTDRGWGAAAQDQGGYKMPARWVNAVQDAQTSHLPDPWDPAPAEQGIGVYYCRWDYGGVSFAILEDRKFKSAPANVLPPEAQVENGWIQNPGFDIRRYRELPGASLLGERQMHFLEEWARDWSGSAYLKVVLSQTNFAAVHTIPADATSGAVLPGLPVPPPGVYVEGDKLAVDMDSNGWPQARRDEVLRVLRRCAAFHIAGDQHLATLVHHGIEEFDDAAFSFTGPALNNLWPRRWWPPERARVAPLDDPGPPYTGRFLDGFGNRVTVHAAANPRATGLEPRIVRDRATGYGIITFRPTDGRIEVACWPRHVDPAGPDARQYEGWPVTVAREEGDGRRPVGFLPLLRTPGLKDPVVEVTGPDGALVYARRVASGEFTPPVFEHGVHRIRVGDPSRDLWQQRTVPEREWGRGVLEFDFRGQ